MNCPFCKVEHLVTVPTVHLNGTSAEDLYAQLDAAIAAMLTAMERLVAASPNGRDYYVQEAGAIERALDQHRLRFEQLRAIQRELIEMRDHVMAVMDFKEESRPGG
jgi:hypothetical protein